MFDVILASETSAVDDLQTELELQGVTRSSLAHLSLCGESLSESYESPYCIPGHDMSVQPQLAALLAMHAGLLHLLVPTELDIPPDWQSEFMLSVRSMLHVCSSCLRVRAHVSQGGSSTLYVFSDDVAFQ